MGYAKGPYPLYIQGVFCFYVDTSSLLVYNKRFILETQKRVEI